MFFEISRKFSLRKTFTQENFSYVWTKRTFHFHSLKAVPKTNPMKGVYLISWKRTTSSWTLFMLFKDSHVYSKKIIVVEKIFTSVSTAIFRLHHHKLVEIISRGKYPNLIVSNIKAKNLTNNSLFLISYAHHFTNGWNHIQCCNELRLYNYLIGSMWNLRFLKTIYYTKNIKSRQPDNFVYIRL